MEDRSVFAIGLKEIIGNFTPSYIIVLVFLYLSNRIYDTGLVAIFILTASLIAIALSAIQPYLLMLILRRKDVLRKLTEKYVNKLVEEEENIDKEKARQNIRDTYLSFVNKSISEFWEKRENATGVKRQFYDLKEARIFLFFYLSISFALIILINIIQYVLSIEIFPILFALPNEFNFFFLSTIFIAIGFGVFVMGYEYEIGRYLNRIYQDIPVFATTNAENTLDEINSKIQLLEEEHKEKRISDSTYSGLKTRFEDNLHEIEELLFEEKWINQKVSETTNIDELKIRELSKEISIKISKPSILNRFLIIFILSAIISLITVIILFPSMFVTNYVSQAVNNVPYGWRYTIPPTFTYVNPLPFDPIFIVIVFIILMAFFTLLIEGVIRFYYIMSKKPWI